MILTTGKTRGFVIEGSSQELRKASMLPGAVHRKREGVVRLPENLASWRALRHKQFDIVDDSALEALEALERKHREHRRRVRNAERRFKLTGETDIPVPLKSIPREHQVRGFGFCSALDESALFADMGTGKTLIAIAVCGARYLEHQQLKVLVICPKSVKPVWPHELEKHAGYEWTVGIDSPPEGDGCQFWVTNYDRVKREQRRLAKWKPDMIILDESHRIKNRKAGRTKAITSLKSRYRLIMSGTPMGKCISEVWAQFNFLRKDHFGSYTSFRERYLKMGGYMGYTVVGYKNEDEFSEKLHALAFRVTKDECLDLPPLSYQRLYVESDRETKKIYQDMELNMFLDLEEDEVTADREITKQIKLRQIVGGLVKTDSQAIAHVSRLKASTLEEILEDRGSKKTVVYFSFTHEITIAKEICSKLKLGFLTLQGSTPPKEREEFQERFQNDPGIQVALIQVATGAEGMTLTAADTAIFYSPTFSFIGFSQARDRINRMGQVNPMTIIFLIMAGTVDEHIVDVLESNRQLTDTFLETKRTYQMATKKGAAVIETTKETKTTAGYNAAQMAESLGTTPAELRKHLRATGAEKPEGGWNWPSKKAAADVEKAVAARMKELASKPVTPKAAKTEDAAPAKKASRKASKAEPEAEAAPEKKPARSRKPASK